MSDFRGVGLPDPTYDKEKIRANPEWDLAFILSEIYNDRAPLGWSKYIGAAQCLRAEFDIQRKPAAWYRRRTMSDHEDELERR